MKMFTSAIDIIKKNLYFVLYRLMKTYCYTVKITRKLFKKLRAAKRIFDSEMHVEISEVYWFLMFLKLKERSLEKDFDNHTKNLVYNVNYCYICSNFLTQLYQV